MPQTANDNLVIDLGVHQCKKNRYHNQIAIPKFQFFTKES